MKRVFNSIQAKLFFTVASVVIMTVLFLVIINGVVFEAYYYYHIKNHLISSYEQVLSEKDNVEATMKNLSQIENIEIEITDNENKMIHSTKNDFIKEFESIPDVNYEVKYSIFNQDEVVYNKNNAMICKIIDKVTGVNVILLKGKLDDGYVYIIKPISIVEESIKISNRSIWTIAIFSVTISAVAVMLITVKFAKPISELNELAKSMSNLDFSKKYTMHNTDDELNQLGMSINVLSSTLEQKIKELEKHNMQLERDIEEKSKIDEMRKQFISDVSHELKTPLTSIKGFSETLLDGVQDAETINHFIKVIYENAERMEKLVQDLLTLSKYDRKTEIKFTTFDLGKLTKSCVEKFEIEVQRKGQKLNSYVTSNIPDITGDYDGLERVIINIISNSVKYTPEGGSIDVYVGSFRNIAYIKIKDTGIGISRKDLDRVFDRFYRVDKARSREMGGTGLGLSIAKQIVEQNGGNIEIKSEPGKGTEVIIQVPIKNDKE